MLHSACHRRSVLVQNFSENSRNCSHQLAESPRFPTPHPNPLVPAWLVVNTQMVHKVASITCIIGRWRCSHCRFLFMSSQICQIFLQSCQLAPQVAGGLVCRRNARETASMHAETQRRMIYCSLSKTQVSPKAPRASLNTPDNSTHQVLSWRVVGGLGWTTLPSPTSKMLPKLGLTSHQDG